MGTKSDPLSPPFIILIALVIVMAMAAPRIPTRFDTVSHCVYTLIQSAEFHYGNFIVFGQLESELYCYHSMKSFGYRRFRPLNGWRSETFCIYQKAMFSFIMSFNVIVYILLTSLITVWIQVLIWLLFMMIIIFVRN